MNRVNFLPINENVNMRIISSRRVSIIVYYSSTLVWLFPLSMVVIFILFKDLYIRKNKENNLQYK